MSKKLVDQRIDEIKALLNGETKSAGEGVETKAGEVVHTTNTGYGAELVPDSVLLNEIISLIPTYSSLLAMLPGNHGTNMPKSAKVPVLGEAGFFEGEDEWTDNGDGIYDGVKGNSKGATAEIEINQKQLVLRIPISNAMLNYSQIDVETWIKGLIAKSAARTIESMIINADPATTGNINGTYNAKAHWALGHTGLRKTAFDQSSTLDIGTLDTTDIFTLNDKLGDMATNPDDVIFLMNRSTNNKLSSDAQFVEAYKSGRDSTINTGAVGNLLGSDVFIARDFWKTAANGKVSATAADNVKGGVLAFNKVAVQYGFGQEFNIEVVKVPAKGIMLIGYFDFGFAIASKLAGQTDPTVALGYDVTLL